MLKSLQPWLAVAAGSCLAMAAHGQLVVDAGSDVTICSGEQVTLGGAAPSGGTPPYSYSWTPAAGLSNTNILHPVCSTTTTRTYTLTVVDFNNETATSQVTVTVKPTPNVQLTCTNANTTTYGGVLTFSVCDQGALFYDFDFADASSAQPGATFSITWGNGQTETFTGTGWTSTQHFPIGLSTGTYTITQPAPNGCSKTVPFNVFVGEVPLGGLSVVSNSTICTGGSISFEWNNFGTNPPGTLYIVDYGDGQVDTLMQPPATTFSHTYLISSCTAGGEFSISWRITNPCDTRTGVIGQIRVSGSPVPLVDLSNDTVCVNTTVSFTDASQGTQAPACTSPRRVWGITPATGWTASGNMGNPNGQPGNPSAWTNGSSPLAVTFNTPGSYMVMTVVGNVCGVDTIYSPVCVEQAPVPAFNLSATTGCSPLMVDATNGSVSVNSCQTRYNWTAVANSSACGSNATATFTGGSNAGSTDPSFALNGAGTYTITLEAINSCGTFPVQQNVSVGAPPQVVLDPPGGICAGQTLSPTATFTPCGTPITSYNWGLGSGIPATSSSAAPGVVAFPTAGNTTITATAGSACGSGTDNASLVVSPLPPAPVVGGPITLCVGEDLQLAATPVPGATFHWTGPSGFTSDQAAPVIPDVTMAQQGVYSVSLSTGGCYGPSGTVSVTVNPAPVIGIIPTAPTVCQGGSVTFTATGGGNYQWEMDGTPLGSGSPFTFTPDHTGTVVLRGEANNCTGAASTLLTVYPLPVVDAGPDRVYCEGGAPQQIFAYTPNGTWSGSPYVTPGGEFDPAAEGSYVLHYSVTSPQGCANADSILVTVVPPPAPAVAGPDTTVCLNDPPIQFTGSPSGGTWNGDISLGGMFFPVAPGSFVVTYSLGAGSCATSDQATVTVLPLPVIDPGADASVCVDAPPVTLAPSPANGTWAGTGVTGGDFDPQAAGTGTHVLTYSYTDPAGCTNTADLSMTVNPLPAVDAGADTTFCDQPFAQTLSGYTPPQGGTWSGAGVSPDGTFLPNGPGLFTLTYTYTDGNGCGASDQMDVAVITITNPATAGNDTAVCINSGPLQLQGGPAGGAWSGQYVDDAGVFTPGQEGGFVLTYAVGTGSCVTMDQVTVTVNPLPQLDITAMAPACVDAGVQTFGASPGGGTWSGAGISDAALGTFDPAATGSGQFPITYTYTGPDGCTNSITGDMVVNPLPVAAFSHDPIACSQVAFPFTDQSSGADAWDWDFGDGGTSTDPSPSHVFDAPGSYSVVLTTSSAAGCSASIAQDVTVWEGPTVAFSLDVAEGCGPLQVGMGNQSFGDGVSYHWDFGDGTTSVDPQPGPHAYGAGLIGDTTYVITLTGTNTCGSVDAQQTVTVHPAPTAVFGTDLNSGCSPWPVNISNVSLGLPDTYWWDFGDGTTGTTPDSLFQHTYYTGAGDSTYTITLIAANACGTDTAQHSITVLPNSITAFFNTDTTSGCAPLTVNFTQFSIGVTNWHWEFGDGEVDVAYSVTHTYDSAGTYVATLFADNGCSFDTLGVVITVLPTPPASFTITPGLFCAGTPVQFTNNTPSPAGLEWDFGDGGTSTLSAPQHSYAAAGTYTVTLSVASATSPCPAMASQTVTVLATPVASISAGPTSGCIPLEVAFQSGSGNTDFYQWDFGDGTTSASAAPAHTFLAAGTFQVQLVAENLNGCTDTAQVAIVAFPLPASSFTLSAGEACGTPATVQLTSTSTGAVGHAWDFGNNTGSVLNHPVAVYDAPGIYAITLVVSNQYGCTDTSTGQFTVYQPPVAAFGAEPLPACAGYPVHFSNHSVDASAFAWSFGDGEGSSEGSPAHVYAPGDYSVTLIATGEGGCTDTTHVPGLVHVDPRPVAAFSYEAMESTVYALQFHNESQGADHWVWHFGDGDSSTVREPLHLYPAGPGDLYPLCLVAINGFGCPDTTCRPVVATSDPEIFAPNAFTPDNDGVNEDFLPILNGFDNWRYQLLIFDRWGEVIFQTSDRYERWKGTCRGRQVKSDVYVWKVILNRGGDERVYHGHVTVVRGSE